MRVFYRLLLALFLSLALVGCVDAKRPLWYQTQGITLTECGPTVAAMAAAWAGHPMNRFEARNDSLMPLFWHYHQIESSLKKRGIHTERRAVDVPDLDSIGIYHVDGFHYVIAANIDFKEVKVYDPLGSISTLPVEDFMSRLSQPTYIAVTGQ